jgi:hypothetical protein
MERLSHSFSGSGQAVDRASHLQGCARSRAQRLSRRLSGGILRWNLPHHTTTYLRRYLCCYGEHYDSDTIPLRPQIGSRLDRPALFVGTGNLCLSCLNTSAPLTRLPLVERSPQLILHQALLAWVEITTSKRATFTNKVQYIGVGY